MSEEFISELTGRLSSFLAAEDLEAARRQICMVTNDYDITKKSRDLVPYRNPVPKCVEYFIVSKGIEGKSNKTLALYNNYISHMFLSINKPVEDITPNDLRCYLYGVQLDRGLSNRTLDSRRSVLSSFFSWIAAEGYVGKNPMVTIKPIKYEVKERVPLKAIDMEQIRAACETDREKAIVEFFYSTACRVSELTELKIADVNFAQNEVILFGKGGKHRRSYLSARASLYLKTYLESRDDECDYLFVSSRKPHNKLTKGAVEKIIKTIGNRAGCDNLFPHLIRHTSATDALKHGMDVTQLKTLLGHSSLDTTMIYAKVSADDVRSSHLRTYN